MGIFYLKTNKVEMVKGAAAASGKGAKGTKGKKATARYTISLQQPVEDNIIVLGDFESFLNQKIKVDGKTGNLGDKVTITKDKFSIVVTAKINFSKRYLKYLTKKYLKKQDVREFLRVVATSKNQYEVRFLQVDNDEGGDDE